MSHDREFFDNVVTSTFVLEGDALVRTYPGGYEDYLRQRPSSSRESRAVPERSAAPRRRTNRLSYNEQRELAALPERIAGLEAEIAAMEGFLADGSSYGNDPEKYRHCSGELPRRREELESAVERWAELEERASL